MITKSHVQLANKLYDAQDAAKKLYGNEYESKIEFYKTVLEKYSQKHNKDIIVSATEIIKDDQVSSNGVAVMLFCAALAEILQQ